MNTTTSPQAQKEIKVPPLGESITEATISRWLKKLGDPVKLDEPVAEIETDKVTLEIGSPATGVLTEIIVQEGATVTIGTVIGKVTEGAASVPQTEVPEKKTPEEKPQVKQKKLVLRLILKKSPFLLQYANSLLKVKLTLGTFRDKVKPVVSQKEMSSLFWTKEGLKRFLNLFPLLSRK